MEKTWKPMRVAGLLLLGVLLLAACTSSNNKATPEPTPDPVELAAQAAANIRDTASFRMSLEQSGAPYNVLATFGDTDVISVVMRRAVAQYVSPDVMQASVRLIASGFPADVEIFSKGLDQWYRAIFTANIWLNAPFAEGFDPAALIAEESGFQAALGSLLELQYIGSESLEDGTDVYHLAGIAHGPDITALLVGLVQAQGEVPVDVYIDRETLLPVRLVVVLPETATEEYPEPTTWTIDVYDFNAEPEIDTPG